MKQRLDKVLSEKIPYSRSFIQTLIKAGNVTVNGKKITDANTIVDGNVEIVVDDSVAKQKPPKIEIPIIYEDENCVVINKPVGLLTHSKGAFNPEPTVASWLAERANIKTETNRDGIVHRLDRATSGVMICAKNAEAHTWLQKQFSSRRAKKRYAAIVEGELDPRDAIIDMPIERNPKKPQTFRVGPNGKPAITEYKTERYIEKDGKILSLLLLSPKTGRTHQLRVHLAHLHHPIVGDELYGSLHADRLYLHALNLELTLPDKNRMSFNAKLPREFDNPNLEK